MMYRIGGVALAGAVLAGCAITPPSPNPPPSPSNDAAICLAALVSAGVSGGLGTIPSVAFATPACQALAADVLAELIKVATGNAAAVRMRMGR